MTAARAVLFSVAACCLLLASSSCGEAASSTPPVTAGGSSAAPATPPAAEKPGPDGFPERWLYAGANLGDDAGMAAFEKLLDAAHANHCTHVLMPEGRWLKFPHDEAYIARVAKVKAYAQKLGLTIIPEVISIGYSGRYFCYGANLAAGLPVKDMPFIVKNGVAQPDPAIDPDLTGVKIDGDQAAGVVKLTPFIHYRLTFRLTGKTDAKDLPQDDSVIFGVSSAGKRRLIVTNPRYQPEADGKGFRGLTTFNSLDADAMKLHIDGHGWQVSDMKIDCAGLLLIVRRKIVPLTVQSADGKTTYVEGRDFVPVEDPCLKVTPYSGDTTNDHAPAVLTLTPDSRIHAGEHLKLSFWHTLRIYDDQDSMSLTDPRTFEILEKEFKDCDRIWKATGYMLGYDEIRIGGWEPRPDGRTLTPGEMLAEHFKWSYDLVKQVAPDATVYTWSDMFTPFHNARPADKGGDYYLVNGTWAGSWKGLPKDVVILNWYAPTAASIQFFADRGNPQVLCGFYDASKTAQMQENIDHWLKVSKGQPGILGFMYTTWGRHYAPLGEYFKLLDKARD
ncbi:MAG: hypothetical protein ACREJ2_07180 [Planctomycetota bacterium]